MNTEKHNGWTNYATWRIHLEMFDGIDHEEYLEPNTLRDMAETIIECDCPYPTEKSLAVSYAMAFMADVNWYEISQHVNERD